MTVIEQRYYDAVIAMSREMKRKHSGEQRRYEIAKEVLPSLVKDGNNADEAAGKAVEYADALLKALGSKGAE